MAAKERFFVRKILLFSTGKRDPIGFIPPRGNLSVLNRRTFRPETSQRAWENRRCPGSRAQTQTRIQSRNPTSSLLPRGTHPFAGTTTESQHRQSPPPSNQRPLRTLSALCLARDRIDSSQLRLSALDRTVAPSGPPTLTRRKSAPATSSQSTPTRIIYREAKPSSGTGFPFWQQSWFIALLFLMAIGFFALAVFLFLGLDLDQGSPSPSYAATSEGVEITYGSAIKLMHEKTKFRLHSHDVPYGSGSGQQSVTGFPGVDDANSYWIIRPEPGTGAKQGDSIASGTIIRLQHMRTRKWLHSHLHASPITGNMEVSCFGGESESDTGDYWRLIIEGSGKTWKQDQRVRLHHVDTGGYLHSHDKKYQRIAGGQQEVCGVRDKRPDNIWMAAEGVYFPVTEKK